MLNKSIYIEQGYLDREDYLKSLSSEYGKEIVYSIAEMLGPEEDFDGLVTALEDYEETF